MGEDKREYECSDTPLHLTRDAEGITAKCSIARTIRAICMKIAFDRKKLAIAIKCQDRKEYTLFVIKLAQMGHLEVIATVTEKKR